MAVPSACQQQNREHAARRKPLPCPRARVPIAAAGDRAGMLRTGQGARTEYERIDGRGRRLISGRATRKQKISFGPFMIAGAFLVILAAPLAGS
jgi:hypothetical protein